MIGKGETSFLDVEMTSVTLALALTTASWLPTSLVPTPFTCRAAHHQRTAVQCVAAERVTGKSTPFDDDYISIPGDEEVEAADVLASLALDDDGGIAGDSEKLWALDNDDPNAAPTPDPDDPDRPPIAMFNVDETTVTMLAEKGITHFTPIQAQSYDMLRAGHDMLGRSRTGTGKTLAFALPLVQRLAEEQRRERPERGRAPRMLVLVPTRELAKQVGEVIQMLGRPHRMEVHTFTGGTPYPPQERALRNGIDVLVGTPGRIIDHLNNGGLLLDNLRHVVLDEADEMLNMGFKEDVEQILEAASAQDRQTVLFSATHPPWVRDVSRQHQTDPIEIDAVGKGQSEAATSVDHRAVLTPAAETARCSTLADVIAVYGTENAKTIVFTSTKREVDELCASSALSALSPQALHGDFSQAQRDLTLRRFREGLFNVLVATDVAARGIDIQGIDLVVQYRLPQDPDSYVHRSGRTGRAGRTGTSLLLYSEREEREVDNLERRANVRFEKSGPPSTSTVMAAAAQLVPRRLKAVEPKVQKYFTAAAAELLAGDDVIAHVAQALALVAGKVTLTQRSLLTGEEGQTTLLLEAGDGSMLTAGDAMAAINRLGKTSSGERAADHVGKIRACEDASQVLPLPRERTAPLRLPCALGCPSLRRIKSTAVVPFTAVAPADVDAAHSTRVLRQRLRLPCCGVGGPGPLRVPSRQASCDVARAARC